MKLKQLIAACNRHDEKEQQMYLTDVLTKVLAQNYGHDIKALPVVVDALGKLIEEQKEKDPKDTDGMFLLTVLDSITSRIAEAMLSRQEFDFLGLRLDAENYLEQEANRQKVWRKEF